MRLATFDKQFVCDRFVLAQRRWHGRRPDLATHCTHPTSRTSVRANRSEDAIIAFPLTRENYDRENWPGQFRGNLRDEILNKDRRITELHFSVAALAHPIMQIHCPRQ